MRLKSTADARKLQPDAAYEALVCHVVTPPYCYFGKGAGRHFGGQLFKFVERFETQARKRIINDKFITQKRVL